MSLLSLIHGLRYLKGTLEINMINKTNPFHDLYVTEAFGPDVFVKLFSNVLVDHAAALFKPGNVILKGLPGTGKTMMLSLLEPSIRVAYKESGVPFPVQGKFGKFVGAGINLIRSNVSDFGQRPLHNKDEINELAIYFGDFVNYWIVRDILASVKELSASLSEDIGIDFSAENLNSFTNELKTDECWLGYLDEVNSYDDLFVKFKHRLKTYRSYLHFNFDNLPNEIVTTKTAIGIPISKTVELLRKHNILKKGVQVFIRIDQYEELSWLDKSIPGLGSTFKSVINKLLAKRDATVSYRVGTRPFAWSQNHQEIFGTSARLELSRTHLEVSIDDVLRRPENVKTYIFPKFAEDIFAKRLRECSYIVPKNNKNIISEVFGTGMSASDKAFKYLLTSKSKAVVLEKHWPEEWKQFLLSLAEKSPFSARLGEAWARQKGKEGIVNKIPPIDDLPWERAAKKYWIKERTEQALLQIASRNSQQLIWEGSGDILTLSDGSILAFLDICQQIWEVWMRDFTKSERSQYQLPKIDASIQTLGILQASASWLDKLSGVYGGKERKQFISHIGVLFRKQLTEDLNMSYPGHNGFSLEIQDQERSTELDKFLKEASDFGDLQDRPHTTKSKDGKKRIKWYLNRMLSPYFKIPAIHTKEPMYVTAETVNKWFNTALNLSDTNNPKIKGKNVNKDKSNDSSTGQTALFN